VTRCSLTGTAGEDGPMGSGVVCCHSAAAVVRCCVMQRLRFGMSAFHESLLGAERCLLRHNAIGLSTYHEVRAARGG
jgi:hypothetical protein